MKVFYGRVSTKKDEQDSSILNQEKYFAEKGIKKGYIDRSSGTTIDKRPEFQQLLKDCGLDIKKVKSGTKYKSVVVDTSKKSKIKYIYTKSISRFARNVSECLEIARMLKAKGTYVIFEDINKSTEDESFFMTMSIMATMAENESREKSRSIKMGAAMSAKAGVVRSWSAYGYEYDKETNTMKAIPEEAEVIRKIFELKVNNGWGGRRIANELNKLSYRTRKDKEWLPHVINKIVKNPIYTGMTTRNRYDSNNLFGNNNRKLKSEDEWILINNGKVEQIIDEETFNKAQEVRKKFTTEDKANGNYVGVSELAQKIICEKCNKTYTRNKDTKVRSYGKYERVFYNCSTKKKYGKDKCNNRNVSQEELDKVINKYIKPGHYKKLSYLALNNVFEEYAGNYITDLKASINLDNKDRIKENDVKISKLKAKLSKLLDMYLDDGIAEDVYKEKEQYLKNEINKIEKENINLNESESEILDRINTITQIKNEAIDLVNNIEDNISREDFIENHILYIEVKEDSLFVVTRLHILLAELVGKVRGVKNGSDEILRHEWSYYNF